MGAKKIPPITSHPVTAADQELLRSVAFFHSLSTDQIQQLLQAARIEVVSVGALVLRAGTNCGALFVVVQGTLRVYLPQSHGDTVLNLVGRGEVLGEICASDEDGHTADVKAIEPCRLLRIERRALQTLKTQSVTLRDQWERLLTQRMRIIHARQISLASGKVVSRVAYLLVEFAQRYQPLPPEKVPSEITHSLTPLPSSLPAPIAIPLRVPQEDLASLVGASRFRVNECLGQFAARGWIRQEGQQFFTVLNLTALRQMATGKVSLA